jgi:hypothetical protein
MIILLSLCYTKAVYFSIVKMPRENKHANPQIANAKPVQWKPF